MVWVAGIYLPSVQQTPDTRHLQSRSKRAQIRTRREDGAAADKLADRQVNLLDS